MAQARRMSPDASIAERPPENRSCEDDRWRNKGDTPDEELKIRLYGVDDALEYNTSHAPWMTCGQCVVISRRRSWVGDQSLVFCMLRSA